MSRRRGDNYDFSSVGVRKVVGGNKVKVMNACKKGKGLGEGKEDGSHYKKHNNQYTRDMVSCRRAKRRRKESPTQPQAMSGKKYN